MCQCNRPQPETLKINALNFLNMHVIIPIVRTPAVKDLMDAIYHTVADKWKHTTMTPTSALLEHWRCG